MFKKKNSLVGLDIGSRTIKVAELTGGGEEGYTLKQFGINDIEAGLIEDGNIANPEGIADAIKQLFKMYKIKESSVAISIGGYSVIVKTITIQKMETDEQLQETINQEAEQYIPFDINDVNLDFQVLGDNDSDPNQQDILLVAAKKEIVEDHSKLIQLAGLTPCIIDVDAFALQNIYEVNYDIGSESVALIDVGAFKTTLNIIRGKQSVLIRDVSLGCGKIDQQIISRLGCSLEDAEQFYRNEDSDDLANKEALEIIEKVTIEWCVEIKKVLEFFYATYPGEQIARIILSGGGSNITTFRQNLANETSSDVEMINPFRNLSVGGRFDPDNLEQVAPQAAICIGLAMRRPDDK